MAISRFSTSRLTLGLPKSQTAWDQDAVEQGAIVPIANGVVTGTATDITFTGIPAIYQDLMFVITGRSTTAATEAGVYIGFNGQYGGNTNYSFTQISASGSAVANARATSQPFVGGDGAWAGATAGVGIFSTGIMHVFDYASANKFKTYLLRSSSDINAAGGGIRQSVGVWRNTAAITSTYLTFAGGMVSGSTVALYGIKAGV